MNPTNKICEYLKKIDDTTDILIQYAYIEAFHTAIERYITDHNLQSCESIIAYQRNMLEAFKNIKLPSFYELYKRRVLTNINDPAIRTMLVYIFNN